MENPNAGSLCELMVTRHTPMPHTSCPTAAAKVLVMPPDFEMHNSLRRKATVELTASTASINQWDTQCMTEGETVPIIQFREVAHSLFVKLLHEAHTNCQKTHPHTFDKANGPAQKARKQCRGPYQHKNEAKTMEEKVETDHKKHLCLAWFNTTHK